MSPTTDSAYAHSNATLKTRNDLASTFIKRLDRLFGGRAQYKEEHGIEIGKLEDQLGHQCNTYIKQLVLVTRLDENTLGVTLDENLGMVNKMLSH
jgi:hypothetical protein